MSYKALYDILYFITLSAHDMLFKAYLTYICFLSDIYMFLKENIFSTTYSVQQHIIPHNIFLQQHILLFNIYGLYDIFVQQHIYVFKQHAYVIEFDRTYACHVSLNKIYVILM